MILQILTADLIMLVLDSGYAHFTVISVDTRYGFFVIELKQSYVYILIFPFKSKFSIILG